MKKLFFLLLVCFAATTSFAQQDSARVKKMHHDHAQKQAGAAHTQNAAAFACPKCYHITKEGGTCSMDQTAMVQLGTYYCPACVKSTGAKAGKCPSCGGATVQMTRKLCAKHAAPPMKKAA